MSCSCVNNIVNCKPCYCGCGHSCMCQCCISTSTTQTTTVCDGEPCEEAVDPNCIIYCGPDLPCYGIKTGDSAADILQVVLNFFGPNCPTTTTTSTTTTSTTTTSTTTSTTSTTTTTTIYPCSCLIFSNSGPTPVNVFYIPCNGDLLLSLEVPVGIATAQVCGQPSPDGYPGIIDVKIDSPCISFGEQFFCDGDIPPCAEFAYSRIPGSTEAIEIGYVDCSGNWVYLEFAENEPAVGIFCFLFRPDFYYISGPVYTDITLPCGITTSTTSTSTTSTTTTTTINCVEYGIYNGVPSVDFVIEYYDCLLTTVTTISVPGGDTAIICAQENSPTIISGTGFIVPGGPCADPTTTTTSTSSIITTSTTETPPAICPNVFEIVVEPTIDTLDFQLYGYDATLALIDGTVDWGDGSPIDTFSGSNTSAPTHTYATPGIYTITWTVNITCGNSFYVDFWSERDTGFSIESKITSISSILNPNPSTLIVKGKDTMALDFSNSVEFNLTIEGQDSLNPLSITNIIDVSTATTLYVVSFTYANAAGLLLPTSQPNNTFTLIVDYGNNTFMNDMLIAADASGMVNQAFSTFSSGTASGLGLTAYNNLVTKGWTMNIVP